MSDRELVVLGTSSKVPTRNRNHNGYLLLWDDEGVLVDPGEGTQRQLVRSGVRSTRITRVCLTHLHGDHCLGLPGVLARLSDQGVRHPVHLHFPASGLPYVERLLTSSIIDMRLDLVLDPVEGSAVVVDREGFRLRGVPLDHSTDCLGWRIEEAPRRHMVPEQLAAHGVHGPAIGALEEEGTIRVGDRQVTLEDVTVAGSGNSAAFVFDTRWCDGALELAEGTDLLVCESTFLGSEEALAHESGHLTAAQAGQLAARSGAGRLVLTHFSSRYPDVRAFHREAAEHFGDVLVAEDLMRVPVPRPRLRDER